jgi:hypothetical protein
MLHAQTEGNGAEKSSIKRWIVERGDRNLKFELTSNISGNSLVVLVENRALPLDLKEASIWLAKLSKLRGATLGYLHVAGHSDGRCRESSD